MVWHATFTVVMPPKLTKLLLLLVSSVNLIRLTACFDIYFNLYTAGTGKWIIWNLLIGSFWDISNSLSGGGYVISPVNQGKHSVVKHMLAIDWKYWKSYLQTSSARSMTIKMLGRVAGTLLLLIDRSLYKYLSLFHISLVSAHWIKIICFYTIFVLAALRELFRAKLGNYSSSEFSSGELRTNFSLHQNEGDGEADAWSLTGDGTTNENISEEVEKLPSEHASLVSLNDASDEFFDVPEPPYYDQSESDWTADFGSDIYSQVNDVGLNLLLLDYNCSTLCFIW